jgi:hypothetical protein
MGIQTASTTELDEAQRTIIAKARFTQEFTAPMLTLVEHFTLGKGERQLTIPKVGQMTAADLTDGTDMTNSADIGMTAEQIDCEEVGLKVIITDKLARQLNEDVWAMVGRQVGDAMGRKKDKDLLDLFDTLTPTNDGSDALTLSFYAAAATILEAVPVPLPINCVVHPYQAHPLKAAVAVSGTYPIPQAGLTVDVIKQWHVGTWAGVPCFEDGNIAISTGTAKGGMFSKSCLGYLQSLADTTERERDASLRATELVIVSDYEAFIIDATYGREMHWACVAPAVT